MREIYKFSRGVPRLVNMIVNRCLIAGFVGETHAIDRSMVKRARESLYGDKYKKIKKIKDRKYPARSNGRSNANSGGNDDTGDTDTETPEGQPEKVLPEAM